ncbi:MAG: divalent metal cation transporter, partial [Planctomycetaceae bacterium]|nr:divalent metal cation transporter [Planctomycetaceae bacterium]
SVILLTSWRVFYGDPNGVELKSVGDVALQLEPSFGITAKYIFWLGIFAGAISSFMVNALIGGTVMSDSIGKGSKLDDRWPLHFTTLALLVGMSIAIASFASKDSTVNLIILAQALTILGLPALGFALIYLGTRRELTGPRKVPRWILAVAIVGFLVSCGLAVQTVGTVYDKLNPPPKPAAFVDPIQKPFA